MENQTFNRDRLIQAICSAAMRQNPIIDPAPWRLTWALGLIASDHDNALNLLQEAELSKSSWEIPSQIGARVSTLAGYLESEKDPFKGSGRANAQDCGGRGHSFIRDVSGMYYTGEDLKPISSCRAWLERNAPAEWGAIYWISKEYWAGVLESDTVHYFRPGSKSEASSEPLSALIRRVVNNIDPCPVSGEPRKRGDKGFWEEVYSIFFPSEAPEAEEVPMTDLD